MADRNEANSAKQSFASNILNTDFSDEVSLRAFSFASISQF